MKNFIFTADWHIKMHTDTEFDDKGIPLKLREVFNCIQQMQQYAIDNSISTIIVGGDINDLKEVAHTRAFVLLRKELDPNINYIFLHGNHDASNTTTIDSSIELLPESDHITTIIEPTIIGDNDEITCIPYSKQMVTHIKEAEPNKILISHLGLNEAELSNGISIKSNIKISDLRKFELVLLGHYHKPQHVGNVYYAGSPIQFRRDEAGEEKRFLVIDTETLEVKSIPTEGYRKYYEFVIDNTMNDDPEAVDHILEEAEQAKNEGNYVRIKNKLKNPPVDLTQHSETLSIQDDYEEEYEIRGITMAMGLQAQMERYLEIENVREQDREKYMNVGINIIGEKEEEEQEDDNEMHMW